VTHVQKVENSVRKYESLPGGAQTLALPEHLLRANNLLNHNPQDYRICTMSV